MTFVPGGNFPEVCFLDVCKLAEAFFPDTKALGYCCCLKLGRAVALPLPRCRLARSSGFRTTRFDVSCSVARACRCRWSLGHAAAGAPLTHSVTIGLLAPPLACSSAARARSSAPSPGFVARLARG